MRGSIVIEKILEILSGGAEATADIFDIMTSGYGESRRKAWRAIKFGSPRREAADAPFREKQQFFALMNYLKKQGFVENKKNGSGSFWNITSRGAKKLKVIMERNEYSKQRSRYPEPENDATLKIIAYDIPSKEGSQKRDWLRWALTEIGFTMLQKSVWIGKKKIPEKFLNDLRERNMIPHVHIFEISKRGTLRKY